MRASGVALEGRMKTLGGSPVWGTRAIEDLDVEDWESSVAAAAEGFVDRVRAMAGV